MVCWWIYRSPSWDLGTIRRVNAKRNGCGKTEVKWDDFQLAAKHKVSRERSWQTKAKVGCPNSLERGSPKKHQKSGRNNAAVVQPKQRRTDPKHVDQLWTGDKWEDKGKSSLGRISSRLTTTCPVNLKRERGGKARVRKAEPRTSGQTRWISGQ